jgi:hypothetical protein
MRVKSNISSLTQIRLDIVLYKFLISLKPKKSSKSFFKSEMLDAIVDLAILYDEIISQDKSAVAYFDDLVPLFQIVLHLFRSVNVHNKLTLIVNVYSRIFSGVISSVEIKKGFNLLIIFMLYFTLRLQIDICLLFKPVCGRHILI